MKNCIPLLVVGLLFSASTFAQTVTCTSLDCPSGTYEPPNTVHLPPGALAQLFATKPPSTQLHRSKFSPPPAPRGTLPATFTAPSITGGLAGSWAAGVSLTFEPAWTGNTDGIIYVVPGWAAGSLKTAWLGYEYDGTQYTLYVTVTDTSSGAAQTTNYAFTLNNLATALATIPSINGFVSGGYAGVGELGATYTSPAQDGVTQSAIFGNAKVSWSHNLLAAAEAGQTTPSGGGTVGPNFEFEFLSANGNQAVMLTLTHDITPINQWVVRVEAGNSSLQ